MTLQDAVQELLRLRQRLILELGRTRADRECAKAAPTFASKLHGNERVAFWRLWRGEAYADGIGDRELWLRLEVFSTLNARERRQWLRSALHHQAARCRELQAAKL